MCQFSQYLDKIGEAWFGLPNQSRPTGSTPGPSGGIFSGLGDTGGLLGENFVNTCNAVNRNFTHGLVSTYVQKEF